MHRLFILSAILLAAAWLAGCAPRGAVPPQGARALENPAPTDLPERRDLPLPAQAETVPAAPSKSCPVTQRPEPVFVAPAPYSSEPPERYEDQFWYGTPALWTLLDEGGTWRGLPLDRQGYSQKVFWWSQDFDVRADPFPAFTVLLERLDAEAAPIVAAELATNASADFGTAMLTGVEVPSAGCWKITGQFRQAELSFVVQVTP